MVRRIVWSRRAQSDRKKIFAYWNERNKSNTFSKKLNSLFKEAISIISEYPELGRATNNNTIRIKIVRDYLIFYDIDGKDQLHVLIIWDSRRDPETLERIFPR